MCREEQQSRGDQLLVPPLADLGDRRWEVGWSGVCIREAVVTQVFERQFSTSTQNRAWESGVMGKPNLQSLQW